MSLGAPTRTSAASTRCCGMRCFSRRLSTRVRCSVSASASQSPAAGTNSNPSTQTSQAFHHELGKTSQMAAIIPFASTAMVAGSSGDLYGALAKALDIYSVLLTVRVLMTWFRNINWRSEPFNTLRQFTDPFLNLFRGIIPPIGGIDLSIMLGFFALSFTSKFPQEDGIGHVKQ